MRGLRPNPEGEEVEVSSRVNLSRALARPSSVYRLLRFSVSSCSSSLLFSPRISRMTLLYSFGHCGSYSLFTKKFGSLNDCMAICEEDTVRIDGGTLSGFWNDLGLDTSSIGLFVFKSITGANLGAVKVLLDLFNVGVNVAFGGPLFGVKGFF